jgi:formate dehydrogenase major subunit
MVRVYVDGQPRDTSGSGSLLEFLRTQGRTVPSLCYHPKLGALQTCDACLVLVDGQVVRSCATPLADGMRVDASSPTVIAAQRAAMDRVLENHELACTLCDKNNGDCELHNTALRMGVREQKFRAKPYPTDASSPFYVYNPNQCILCGRCVEACQDLVVNEVLHIDWNRNPPRVVWDQDAAIDRSSCVSCGVCSTVCPVDAMMEKSMVGRAAHFSNVAPETRARIVSWVKEASPTLEPLWLSSEVEAASRHGSIRRTKSVCTFCGVGCSFEVWTRGREVLKVLPRPESPANGVMTCVKGKFGYDFVNSPNRLSDPLVREGERFVAVDWEEALRRVAGRLKAVRERYGPDAIGVIATCTGTNEEAYLTQRFARQVIGTNNVDNCARYCQAPATTGLFRTVGIGADAGTMADIEAADLVMTIGSNAAEAHPVLASRVKRAQKLRGQKLLVVDPRRHELAERADLFVSPRPGTDLVLLNAVARYLIDQGWEDRPFIEARTRDFEPFRAGLERFTLDFAEEVTGVPRAQIVAMAEMFHLARSACILWAMGITQHQNGSDTSTAICNLLLVTGNFGRPGTGGYPLRGHCNVQGVSDFGCLPAYLPGYQKIDDPEARARVEREWGTPLPTTKGLTSTEMIDAILDGRVHALYILGEDKLLADADEAKVARALERLDLLIVQDLFMTRTAEYADVVLPVAASLEKEGTFVSTERRLQRLYRAFPPLAHAKTDGEILERLAAELGSPWNYSGPGDVLKEVARVTPVFAGARYDRLEGFQSLLWPIAPDGTDTPVLHRDRFNFPDGRARFFPVAWSPPPGTDPQFDLALDNGRLLEHFHWGNLTYEDAGISRKVPGTFVEVSPALARERSVAEGDWVRLVSETGAVKARVHVTERVQGSTLFLTLHDRGEAAVNRLTKDVRDGPTKTPDYKGTRVRMERIDTPGPLDSPVSESNPRGKVRSPQQGVRVEEKWARAEYRLPGS